MTEANHVAIILDGNRRFAKRLMAKPWKGHEFGKEKVKKLLEWCTELGVTEVTLYAFSVDNFNRPKQEFDYIMKLFREAFEESKNDKQIHEKKIKINFLGRIDMFPEAVAKSMHELMDATKNYSDYVINFCMAYGGREEIVDAAREMVSDLDKGKIKADEINEETFKNYLYTTSEPDLIIRTGGEQRLSGFLLYLSSYAELFFINRMWPEFEKEDLVNCLEEFKERERRFGR
ncbi:di-trans,poly-cis-decaprenylcistransferase [Candidatus Woesearchaeota archaeon]|nr:di-trans,poly-cis-decaprenylcistransferase [Candidatus Woesearchaeota archaeon]|tara:strand:+ start:24994 stop:25689 length:696 start_codon:yes stop_codon:yes gene_type:complete